MNKCTIRVLTAEAVRVTGWLVWDGGVPSGMVTCWGGPPPAAMESGQKRCSGRFCGVFFLALGVSEELASNMGCRILLRAFMNLQTGSEMTPPPPNQTVQLAASTATHQLLTCSSVRLVWVAICFFSSSVGYGCCAGGEQRRRASAGLFLGRRTETRRAEDSPRCAGRATSA